MSGNGERIRVSDVRLRDGASVWNVPIRPEENDTLVVWQHRTEHEHFRCETGDSTRADVRDRDNLPAFERLGVIVRRDLCARLLYAEFAKIDLQLDGGVPRTRVRGRSDHGAHSEIEVLQLFESSHV